MRTLWHKLRFGRLVRAGLAAMGIVLTPFGAAAEATHGGLTSAASNRLVEGIAEFTAAYTRWDAGRFEAAERMIGEVQEANPRSPLAAYWRGVVRFQLAVYHSDGGPGREAHERAARWVRAAESGVEAAAALDGANPENPALLSSLLGLRIRLHPTSGIWLGTRLLRLRDAALAAGRENPRVCYLVGSGCFHGPAALGGRDKALEHFARGAALYERERREPRHALQPTWGHSSCLAFMGRIHEEAERWDEAVRQYRRALEVEPADKLATEGLRRVAAKRPAAADGGGLRDRNP